MSNSEMGRNNSIDRFTVSYSRSNFGVLFSSAGFSYFIASGFVRIISAFDHE